MSVFSLISLNEHQKLELLMQNGMFHGKMGLGHSYMDNRPLRVPLC